MQQQKMLRSNNDVWVSHGSGPAVVVRAALQRSWRKLRIKLIKFTFAFAAAAMSQNVCLKKKRNIWLQIGCQVWSFTVFWTVLWTRFKRSLKSQQSSARPFLTPHDKLDISSLMSRLLIKGYLCSQLVPVMSSRLMMAQSKHKVTNIDLI